MKKCKLILIFLINYIFFAHSLNSQNSCRDHYLNGKFHSATLPISKTDDDAETFMVECEMPIDGGLHHPVNTVIHSALERWKPITTRQTIGYQVSDREFLQKLIAESNECTQQIFVRWTEPYNNANDEFTLESISGRRQIFRRNESIQSDNIVASVMTGSLAGVLHILPSVETENSTVWIRVSELRCTQNVIKTNDCLFEINVPNDRIRFTEILESDEHIRFSFRTDHPWHRFISLYMKGAQHINIEIIDGYLLNVNHVIHPVKLLADGNWHTAHIDLRVLTLTIDDSETTISLYSGRTRSVHIESIDIFVNGQLTALQIGETSEERAWQCADSDRIQIHSTPQILRRLCPSYEDNYCKCKGPNSALSSFRHRITNCTEPKSQNAYRLSRNSHQLAFFYLKEFHEKSRISVLFKSDSDVGLIFFGMVFRPKSVEEFVTRIQVHYINEVMYAARCIRGMDGTERCHSCSIHRKRGFSTNEWIRVSWFYYNVYQFLAVDDEVCQLSPNSRAILDSSELYMPASLDSFLFVGGYLYAKSSHTLHQINHEFRKKFGENTREKPPSLRGCIADIVIDGVGENLDEVFKMQIKDVAMDGRDSLFSMKRTCPDCESTSECHGARCRAAFPDIEARPVCDCASIYANTRLSLKRSTNVCIVSQRDTGTFDHHKSLRLSTEQSIKLESMRLPLNRRAVVDKIWFLLRFPEANKELTTIMTFGAIRIRVGSYGKRVIVEVDLIKEEFAIASNDDERLHLIAIQRNKVVGTAIEHKTLRIQIDNDMRTITLDEIPISDPYLLITPVITEQIQEKSAGCLAEFVVAYDYREDSHSQIHSPENRVEQTDWLPQIIDDAHKTGLVLNDYCGIRDPNLWNGNSSSYGSVGEYDPYDGKKGTSWIFFIVALAVLILVCIPYCICRRKRYTRRYKAPKDESKMNGHSLRSEIPDKTPLTEESYMEVPRAKLIKQNGTHDLGKNSEPKFGDPLRSTRVSIRDPVAEPIKISEYPSSPRRSNNRPILVRRMPPPASPRIIERDHHSQTLSMGSIPGSPGILLQPQYSSIHKAPIAKPDEL
uniref:LAM_G_DOMAIN domain-containing protein n=1 Tax=Acrobeloides nanus TaxID=290746 RepID=A0A914DRF9_9BILA